MFLFGCVCARARAHVFIRLYCVSVYVVFWDWTLLSAGLLLGLQVPFEATLLLWLPPRQCVGGLESNYYLNAKKKKPENMFSVPACSSALSFLTMYLPPLYISTHTRLYQKTLHSILPVLYVHTEMITIHLTR